MNEWNRKMEQGSRGASLQYFTFAHGLVFSTHLLAFSRSFLGQWSTYTHRGHDISSSVPDNLSVSPRLTA